MLTTVGQLMLHDALPEGVRPTGPVDKGQLGKLLKQIAEKQPKRYGEIVGKLKDVGNFAAFITGTSYSLADLAPMTDARDAAFKQHGKALAALRAEALADPTKASHPEFIKRKAALYAKIESAVNAHVDEAVKAPNGLTSWVASGAKGDRGMLRQMVAMSGQNVDVANKIVPEIAKRSFAEGLSPIDFHVHANGARRGVVNTYTSVREPGAFAKELNTIQADMVVTMADCGVQRGRMMGPLNPDAADRFLASAAGSAHRNDLVTPALQEALAKKGLDTITVRSPLYCQAHDGVCARCYGLNEEGREPAVGEHVGLKAAQAITEPLTQLALNTKHTGGVIGAGKSPFQQIMQVMHAPVNFAGAATLARTGGHVQNVIKAPAGGHHVTIAGQKHYLGPEFTPIVKPGQYVSRGDALSDGQLHPAEIVEHKGMEVGRQHFADTVQKLYGDAGIRGHGKIFETIARGVLNLGQVIQPGEHPHVPGEIVRWNSVAEHMADHSFDHVPLHKAEGRILAQDHGSAQRYQVVTPQLAKQIEAQGDDHVFVFKPNQLVVKPLMMGTERAALHKGDWMANLGFRFLGSRFKENAATGAVSNIHGWNPFPAYAAGAEFGKGREGRY